MYIYVYKCGKYVYVSCMSANYSTRHPTNSLRLWLHLLYGGILHLHCGSTTALLTVKYREDMDMRYSSLGYSCSLHVLSAAMQESTVIAKSSSADNKGMSTSTFVLLKTLACTKIIILHPLNVH